MARAPDGSCATRCQLFITEMAKNETKLRMRWFIKNRQLLLENLQDDKLVRRAEESRKKLEKDRLQRLQDEAAEIGMDKPLPTWRPRKLDNSVNLKIMKPVEGSTRAILYESGVPSYITGNNYLHARYKDKPDHRFYYPDCTNWLYGWRLTDYPPVQATKFGRSAIVRDSFYRKCTSSLQRDPDSHRPCQTTNAKNFNDILTY